MTATVARISSASQKPKPPPERLPSLREARVDAAFPIDAKNPKIAAAMAAKV